MEMLKKIKQVAEEITEAKITEVENLLFKLIELAEMAIPTVQNESERVELRRVNAELMQQVSALKLEIERMKAGNAPAGLAENEED
jgi:hypothetical protein